MKRFFHRYVGFFAIVILIFAISVKLYSIFTFPEISDWNFHQLQRINKSQTNFTFDVFGDNKNSVKTFENLIRKINADNSAFAIDIGDLVYDGEKEKFRFFINQIKKINKPLLTVVGNHEIKEDGRANYYVLFGKFYYSFAVGNSYFIVLDNANKKNIDAWQLDWLKKKLKKSQKYQNRFVFMHVPLFDPRKGDYKKGHSLKKIKVAKRLNKLFDDNNVTMLFVSHIHGYYRGIWGKTPYIITGGGGAELAGSNPEHYFYHYIKVDVDNTGVKYEIVKLKSPDFELIDRWIHDAWIYIYAFFVIHFIDALLLVTTVYLSIYLLYLKWNWIISRPLKPFKE